jgi:NAD(P)-dependent dehydrogenase (short-subunit alcohol dehydrogenase family)
LQVSGSTALVTGGGRRVGRAIVVALAEAGANVAVHYNRSDGDAAETVELARSMGVSSESLPADLSDAGSAEVLVDAVRSAFGDLSILVNNASRFSPGRFEDTSLDEWDGYMAVNFRAPFLLAQAMYRAMPKDQRGKVINLNDWRTARAKRFAYGASKAALSGLTRSLAVAMAPNVQVNELALGAILPPADLVSEQLGPPATQETKLGPAARMGTLNEVSDAVLSVIGNDFITGETLHIDGGRHIR